MEYTNDITHEQAGERILSAAENNLLVQANWQAELEGRHVACLLGSIHSSIEDPEHSCVAKLMPSWMATSTIELFDALDPDNVASIAIRYGKSIKQWGNFTSEKWDRIHNSFQNYLINFVMEQARPACKDIPLWERLESDCKKVMNDGIFLECDIELIGEFDTVEYSEEYGDMSCPLTAMYEMCRNNFLVEDALSMFDFGRASRAFALFNALIDTLDGNKVGLSSDKEGTFNLSF